MSDIACCSVQLQLTQELWGWCLYDLMQGIEPVWTRRGVPAAARGWCQEAAAVYVCLRVVPAYVAAPVCRWLPVKHASRDGECAMLVLPYIVLCCVVLCLPLCREAEVQARH